MLDELSLKDRRGNALKRDYCHKMEFYHGKESSRVLAVHSSFMVHFHVRKAIGK